MSRFTLAGFRNVLRQAAGRRYADRRRRRSALPPVAVLESRLLLSATSIAPLGDMTLASDSDSQSVSLADHFDDPNISGSTVRITTPLGSFIIETYDSVTPLTAQNFVTLASGGNYDDMFIHRSNPNFVIQGGGFTFPEGATGVGNVSHNGTVVNEFDNWFDPNLGGLTAGTPLNVRGTVAMAKQGGNPDSATSQWFVSLRDNSSILDPQNGGFTVFGHVLFDGMNTVDAVAGLQVLTTFAAPFSELPVRDYVSGNVARENLVTTTTTVVDELTFEVTANDNPAVVTAAIVDGQLQVSGVDGQSGTATVTIVATDLQGQTATDTLEVSVPLASVLTAPLGSGHDVRPTFMWEAAASATSYELWVDQVDGTTAIVHEYTLTGTSFTPAEDLPGGSYRAWIRPENAAGKGAWSPVLTFSTGLSAATITSPSTAVVEHSRPVIEWTTASGATEYDLWVNHVGVQSQVIRETSVATNSFTPPDDLADGVYRVWVKAKSSSGESAWSTGVTFEIVTVSAPEFTGPADPVATPRPEITWTGNAAGTFELWVNQIGGTARIIHETAVAGTSFVSSSDLVNGDYRAWVRERPAGEAAGRWSAAFNFEVATVPLAVQISDVTGTDTARPTIVWSTADSAVRYELWVNDVTNGVSRVIHETTLTALQYTAGSDLDPGQYRAWLRAFSVDDTAGPWSAAVNFSLS